MSIQSSQTEEAEAPRGRPTVVLAAVKSVFLRVGVLPFFLVLSLIVFSLISNQFLSIQNLTNVARQSVYHVQNAKGR